MPEAAHNRAHLPDKEEGAKAISGLRSSHLSPIFLLNLRAMYLKALGTRIPDTRASGLLATPDQEADEESGTEET
jgi:hypothetical protein